MKRAVVFAHYDKDAIIDDYVVYYVENLKKVADIIVFVSCNDLSEAEKSKLDVNHIIAEKHEEYDFGSYKRGFLYLKENNLLDDVDELIFANDSCYAPLFPFEDMFNKMEKEPCDFWGVTKNKFGITKDNTSSKYIRIVNPHIQSYFIVFKNNVFTSDIFVNFISKIKAEAHKNDVIINYEIGLTNLICKSGYKYSLYVKDSYKTENITLYKWKQLIKKYHSPFIKACVIRNTHFSELIRNRHWENIINNYTAYNLDFIYKNLKRTNIKTNYKYLIKHSPEIILKHLKKRLSELIS